MWLLSNDLISAVVILLAAAVYGSHLSMQWHDLYLVEPVIAQIEILAKHGDKERLQHIHSNCMQLLAAARTLLESPDVLDTGICPTEASNPTLPDIVDSDWLLVDPAPDKIARP